MKWEMTWHSIWSTVACYLLIGLKSLRGANSYSPNQILRVSTSNRCPFFHVFPGHLKIRITTISNQISEDRTCRYMQDMRLRIASGAHWLLGGTSPLPSQQIPGRWPSAPQAMKPSSRSEVDRRAWLAEEAAINETRWCPFRCDDVGNVDMILKYL